jgi:hypothetical protein
MATGTVQDALQRIAGALEAQKDKQETADERDRADRDLNAQETMANWSRYVVFIAGLEALITLAGVFLVWRTLVHTRAAAEAARDAVTEAKTATAQAKRQTDGAEDASKRELRAYLSVEPLGLRCLVGREEVIGLVSVHNVGHLPAGRVHVVSHMLLSPAKATTMDRQDADDLTVVRTVQPGAAFTQGTDDTPHVSAVNHGGVYIFVFGAAFYDDGYGKRRRTEFCHRYNSGSRLRYIKEMHDANGPPIIAPEKARYHTSNNDAD